MIILFALAVVALGVYPFRKQFKTFGRYVEKVSTDFRNSHRPWLTKLNNAGKEGSNKGKDIKNPPNPAPTAVKDPKVKNDLDKLTKKDKAELNQLIDKLSK